MRILALIFIVAGVTLATAGCTLIQPIKVASGLTSHTLCSNVFAAKQDPQQIFAENVSLRPGLSLVDWAVRYDVDRMRRQVTTTVAGGFKSRAVYRGRFGCILVQGEDEASTPPYTKQSEQEPLAATLLQEIATPEVVSPANERLRAALDRAFAEPDHPPHRLTKAVVVVHNGRVVAERYAPGAGVDTPMLGYSATKSVTNALLGILVRQGKLKLDGAAPVTAWSTPHDPRHAITIDQLLRMTSGLALKETDTGFDPSARMLYLERDMAGFAEQAELEATPGSRWSYSSAQTMILSKIIRDATGENAETVLRFAQHELFEPLGMHDVTLEFDAVGTPIGSTYMLAPARAWARFGMLYLDDGVVGGHRILPEGWVRYSSTPTLDTGYGAGFWTNRVATDIPGVGAPYGLPGAPEDAFYARGILGQYVVVVPSERLVIARFGMSHETGRNMYDTRGVGQLVADVIAALRKKS